MSTQTKTPRPKVKIEVRPLSAAQPTGKCIPHILSVPCC